MTPLQPYTIVGSDTGLLQNKKPFLFPDKAYAVLENAYVYREQVIKRFGLKILGRFQRSIIGNRLIGQTDGSGNFTGNIFSILIGLSVISSSENPSVVMGSVAIHVNGDGTYEEPSPPDGTLSNGAGGTGTINYATGDFTLLNSGQNNSNIHLNSFEYYPGLPVMGIWQRELPAINDEQTIFFDEKYAYVFSVGSFEEYLPITGTTWNSTDSDFFWCTNWRGSTPSSRLFFETNFLLDIDNGLYDPIRYTDGSTWTNFQPYVSRATPPNPAVDVIIYQARILIPYYGRLLALNTWEGTEAGGFAGTQNFFARCRFSQIGSPVQADAWQSDIFGKGGFIDAPTSEQITSATFFKNTLIVEFEKTTWQLRYVGEYGIPFIWERISSDFGSESTFSTILFDQGVVAVGDRAIISSNSITADRIDLAIPDLVFRFKNALNGTKRVIGVRDFENELVYWCYNDFDYSGSGQKFPNKVLLYNYRNNTYAIFRDNVTFFGTFQNDDNVTWDSEKVYWDDEYVTWDSVTNQSLFPSIVSGNQQGFVHYYNRTTPDEASLYISAVDLTTTPIQITIPNHNLVDQETIYISGLLFTDGAGVPISTDLNDKIYLARYINNDTIGLEKWDTSLNPHQYVNNFAFTPSPVDYIYIGGGLVALFPKLDVQTKDFNPYMKQGGQLKLAYVDFLTDATPSAVMSVNLYANTQVGSPSLRANIEVGNQLNETYLTPPYYSTPVSDISWHRYFCTLSAQFIRLQMTYDDELMNQLSTHQQKWVLNAITLWTRTGGKNVF